ncbi:MAG: hypothetical protein RSB90_10305 [Eubacterium sp.]
MNNLMELMALKLTKSDIEKYRCYVVILEQKNTYGLDTTEAALFAQKIHVGLKKLKDKTPEKDFNVFYNKYFLNKKKEIISEALGIDQTTVWRISEKLLKDFAGILYFDLMNFNLLHPWG